MLGAHNTLSFYNPKKWWQYLLLPFAKCQTKNFEELYDSGVRWFDIRVWFDKDGEPHFGHGIVEWDVTSGEVMEKLWELNLKSTQDDPIHIRILLEFNIEPKDKEYQEEKFEDYVKSMKTLLNNCKFTNCCPKYNWDKQIIGDSKIKLVDYYSSVRWKWVFQTFIWLYSMLYNSVILETLKDYVEDKNTAVIIDYI